MRLPLVDGLRRLRGELLQLNRATFWHRQRFHVSAGGPPERPQPVPLVAKCAPIRERVGHRVWPAVLEHAAIVQ